MRKFELIVGLVAILAFILKLLFIAGSGALLILSASTLTLFYFVFSFAYFNGIPIRNIFKKSSYQETNWKRVIGSIGLGFALSAVITGIMSKLQFWLGANFQLMSGLLATTLALIIALIFKSRKNDRFYSRVFSRIIIYGAVGFIIFSTPSSALVDIYYRNNPEYAELFKQVLANPENEELREQLRKMKDEMRKNR